MNQTLFSFGLCNVVIAVVAILSSVPLLRGRIKMNRWFGIRVPKAFKSDENWYRVNRYGSRALIWWSIPILVIGIVMIIGSFFAGEEFLNPGWLIPFYLSGLLLLGALIQTMIWSKRLP